MAGILSYFLATFFFLKKIPQPKKNVLIFISSTEKCNLRVCVVFILDFSWRHDGTPWATRVSWSSRISRGSWYSWES